jgi:threonine/homoserine/homoserine lactone efflux protein
MKGAFGLMAAAAVLWVFWMSWEWLRNRNKNKDSNKEGGKQ